MKRVYFLVFILLICSKAYVSAQSHALDYYIQQGIENSPLIKDYYNQVLSNRIDSLKIRAANKFQVAGTSNNLYAPVMRGWGYDDAITNGANISAVVGVSKTIISQHNLQKQYKALDLLNDQLNNTAKLTEQDLKRTITAQYVTAYGDLQELSFSSEIYSLLKKEDSILRKLTENNVYRQTDYLTFIVTLQQQELVIKQADIRFQADLYTLNYLCGISDTMLVKLDSPSIAPADLPEPMNSVFFKQYLIDSLKLVNDRAMNDLNYKPGLNVFADAGYNSSMAYLPYKNFGARIGFGVTVPIYDGKKRKLQNRQFDIAESTRAGYRDFYIRQYDQQIIQLNYQIRSTEELISRISQQIKYSETLIEANLRLIMTGDARITDLVIALNNYMSAKNQLTQNSVSRWQLINQLNYWNR
ncbi:TolC family protein [Flavitalea sp.]|nr:TolC family protein [Flavitalea sp.]